MFANKTPFLLLLAFRAAAQQPTTTTPLIINQGPTDLCYGWYSDSGGTYPPQAVWDCPYPNHVGRFTLGTYGWAYPQQYQTSPGFNGSVNGANGSELTVTLSNNANGGQCGEALEVNLSFDYPGSALYSYVSTTDLSQYDSVIIEYDLNVVSAQTELSQCYCVGEGSTCPIKQQFTTDIIYYQGSGSELNTISVRHFDPEDYPTLYWNASGGYRVQYSDHQVTTIGQTTHVSLDALYLMHEYSSQLCQGGGLDGPIYLRSIQLVAANMGTDITVDISNVQANAYKYAPGTFTSSSVSPGCTPTDCPTQPANPASSCSATTTTNTPTQTLYGQCGGSGWTGPTACPPGTSCQEQNSCWSIR